MSGAHLLPMWDKGVSQNGYKAKSLAWDENPELPHSVLRTKPCGLDSPKRINKFAGAGTKSSPTYI